MCEYSHIVRTGQIEGEGIQDNESVIFLHGLPFITDRDIPSAHWFVNPSVWGYDSARPLGTHKDLSHPIIRPRVALQWRRGRTFQLPERLARQRSPVRFRALLSLHHSPPQYLLLPWSRTPRKQFAPPIFGALSFQKPHQHRPVVRGTDFPASRKLTFILGVSRPIPGAPSVTVLSRMRDAAIVTFDTGRTE